MPKRSAEAQIERYAKKIRKIEEKQRRRRIVTPFDSSSDSDEGNEDTGQAVENDGNDILEAAPVVPDTIAVCSDTPDQNMDQNMDQPVMQDVSLANEDPEVDPDLLSALGESVSDTPDYGDNIHENLSKLWLPLLKKGMPKDSKEKTLKDYLVPDNCRLLQAPKLNAEISAWAPAMVRNRDKTLAASQQQLGLGITAINRGIDILLKSEDKVQAMKHLSNGCRLLCDSHYLATQSRIKLITPSLDITFLNVVNESERDETLFGSSLSEKIKAAKAIEKQGLQIKKPAKPPKPATPQPGARSASFQGNWTAPPPRYPTNRGGRGGYRRPPPPPAAGRRSYAPPAHHPVRPATQDKTRASGHAQH
ncbi:hypothetical protein JYU34_003052 [Plutella xylostella]|uniref:Uncharacterized protein n=1 Tax=Plutella xylostella TaxID=51655 RepID=A0ABQ7QZ21_PLUXY|nr:hypothetical protein JYU34_003052 [Plutella xylostella]